MVLQQLLEKGGTVMGLIILLSVYVMGVILYKIYQFWNLQAFKTAFLGPLMQSVEDRKMVEAARIAGNQRNPLARVIETTLRCTMAKPMSEDQKIRTIEASGAKELRIFESHLRGLEMAANVAPLLGLLGTVIGMVKAFAAIYEIGSRVDPSVLAGGIWEALLTTVAGLFVAIPALVAYYILDGRVEHFRAIMKDSVSSIMSKVEA